MFRKPAIYITLIFITLILIVIKSPFTQNFYYERGKVFYNEGKYQESISNLDKALFINANYKPARMYYVMSLSKLKPTYTIQKKLYDISKSKQQDEASKLAKSELYRIQRKLLSGFEDNYIDNAISGNKIIRWDIKSFPLKVYYKNKNSVPGYYIENIEKAFNQWQARASFLEFTTVQNEIEANIVVDFEDIKPDLCKNTGKCIFTVAHTEPIYKSATVLQRMNLTFLKTNPKNQPFDSLQIYNTALHEIGHTLGIMGHSDNPNDVMYASDSNNKSSHFMLRSDFQYISSSDIKTLVLLYNLKPDISNVHNLSGESFYYPPIILGDNDERTRKKIKEFESYIQKYPNIASGYINLASVYADSEDFDKALEILNYAQKNLTLYTDEEYLILYNQAIIFYNKQDYTKSQEYAVLAKRIKNTQEVNGLITEISSIRARK